MAGRGLGYLLKPAPFQRLAWQNESLNLSMFQP
jgi:hypothetical protein